jgi:hypothetical protein
LYSGGSLGRKGAETEEGLVAGILEVVAAEGAEKVAADLDEEEGLDHLVHLDWP